MEQLVAELKKNMPFKETTVPGDVVLVAAKEPQMLVYAVVGDIVRDESRKEEWWHVTLHILTMPPQTVTWTLRKPQFTGQELFTMGGEGRFIKAMQLSDTPLISPAGDDLPRKTEISRQKKPGLRIVK